MSLAVEIDVVTGVPGLDQDVLRQILEEASATEGWSSTGSWTLTVRLTGDAEIAELHQRFFNDPAPTDVITFPCDDLVAGGGHLGDIVISVETAAAQRFEFGHSTAREVAFLAIHGLLHILGHRDASPDQRDAMLDRQEKLLSEVERRLGRRL